MAKLNALTHLFSTGEVSRAGLNRVDKEALRLYAERQENIFPYTIGKGLFRPGTQLLATAASRPRYIPFIKSVTDTAILELTNAKLRVLVDDVLVTRPAVTSSVTNGDFSSGTGWTLTVSTGATGDINSTVAGALYMAAAARGSSVICTRSVTTSSAGAVHALRIVVTRGPVIFRCGSTSGADDYIPETTLETGTHSLAFTPSGTYHVHFKTQREVAVIVDSIQVEAAGVMEIAAPWTTAQLREVRRAQSQDVVFLAHTAWRQQRIERRGDASWSLVDYKTDDGPFTTARTAEVKLKVAATHGNTTLTADAAFFRSTHVGALFRLDHNQFNAAFVLAGSGVFTNAWRITGILSTTDNDRRFDYVTTGTWSGTVTVQRSLDGPDSGFRDAAYDESGTDVDFTTNQTISHGGNATDNNTIIWYRMGFKDGDYTSGSINIAVNYDGHSGFGICRVTDIVSDTVANVEILADCMHTEYTDDWLEGDWSDRRGWPSAVGFFDGRLWWARKDKFWGSESNDYAKFNLETEGDSGSVQRDIATGGASNTAKWILGLQRLIIGTDMLEACARSSSFDAPITPTELTIKNCSDNGSTDVEPINAGARGAYVSRDGLKIHELAYNVDLQDYASTDLTRLNDEIAEASNPDLYADGFVELAQQKLPAPYLWAVRNDGIAVNLLYEPSEQARGVFRLTTGAVDRIDPTKPTDRIVSMCVLPSLVEDRVYLGVERTISNGAGGIATAFYLEKMALHTEAITRVYNATTRTVAVKNGAKMVDSFISTSGTSVIGQVITGLTHLAGRQVIICGQAVGGLYGPSEDPYTVSDAGQITTSQAFSGTLYIGLPYEGFYKSAKLAYAAQGGTALTIPKRVQTLGLALLDTHVDALRLGSEFLDDITLMDELPRTDSRGAVVDPTATFARASEERPFPFPGIWDTDSRVCIYCRPGYSACLSGIVTGIETAG